MDGAWLLEFDDWDGDLGKGWAEQPLPLSPLGFLHISAAAACWQKSTEHCGLVLSLSWQPRLPKHCQVWWAEARLRLVGAHQLDNAATAVTAALALARDGYPRITPSTVLAGLGAAALPGRFQVLAPASSLSWAVQL